MQADSESSNNEPTSHHDSSRVASLTDVIDELKRSAFKRALERRAGSDDYRRTIEAAHLVRHSST